MRMVAAGVMVAAAIAAPAAAYAQGEQQQPGGGYIKRVEPRTHERSSSSATSATCRRSAWTTRTRDTDFW